MTTRDFKAKLKQLIPKPPNPCVRVPTDRGYAPPTDLRKLGAELWFEYHCWESLQSGDAALWLRSHRRVTVISAPLWDDKPATLAVLRDIGTTMRERGENGCCIGYRIRFADGAQFYATEDELLDTRSEFQRPKPPKRRATIHNPQPSA